MGLPENVTAALGQVAVYPVQIPDLPGKFEPIGPMTMIAMRMRWGQYGAVSPQATVFSTFPFQFITAFEASGKVFIFLVQNGEPVTLEDESALFPSDGLVTKLRMLEKH